MSPETWIVLLYGQLQSDVNFELSNATAVSGAQNYGELCIAAKKVGKEVSRIEYREQYGGGQEKYIGGRWTWPKMVEYTLNN